MLAAFSGSGEVAGRTACDVEVGESSGREGCEWELGVAHDEDRHSGLEASDPPPCYIALGMVRVCWPAAMECRSGSWVVAKVPKVAMLDGPVRRIAFWELLGWLG